MRAAVDDRLRSSTFADRPDPLAPHDGRIPVPAGPGLGAGLLGWYEA